jgi:hypothetical protein
MPKHAMARRKLRHQRQRRSTFPPPMGKAPELPDPAFRPRVLDRGTIAAQGLAGYWTRGAGDASRELGARGKHHLDSASANCPAGHRGRAARGLGMVELIRRF